VIRWFASALIVTGATALYALLSIAAQPPVFAQRPEGAMGSYPVVPVVAMSGQEPLSRGVSVTLERENTKPTGNIVFWHLQGSGAVCSADADSTFGSIMKTFENAGPVVISVTPVKNLERLSPR
jgi:hypothetical protein